MSGVSEYCNLQVLISSTLLQFDLCGMQGIFLVLVQFERYFQNSSEIIMLFFFLKKMMWSMMLWCWKEWGRIHSRVSNSFTTHYTASFFTYIYIYINSHSLAIILYTSKLQSQNSKQTLLRICRCPLSR